MHSKRSSNLKDEVVIMPPKLKSKNNKADTTTTALSNQLTEFELYRNPAGQIPDIVVNLIKQNLYQDGIASLREILAICRDNNKLISFKVRSPAYPIDTTSKDDLPTFLMQSSSLYIVGYKLGNEIKILKDGDLRYGSAGQYNFYDLKLTQEDYNSNKMVLHTIGYIVAEAVRSKEIERVIIQLIKSKLYFLDVMGSVFKDQGDYDLKQNSDDIYVSDLKDSFNKIEKIKIAKIKGDWEHESYVEAVAPAVDVISDYFRQMLAAVFILPYFIRYADKVQEYSSAEFYDSEEDSAQEDSSTEFCDFDGGASAIADNKLSILESEIPTQEEIIADNDDVDAYEKIQIGIAQSLKPLIDVMQSKVEMFGNVLCYEGGAVKALSKLANGTSSIIQISAGVYQKNTLSSFKYSKTPGSESLAFSTPDDKPDNDKGGGAIHVHPHQESDRVDTSISTLLSYYLSWIYELPKSLQNQILNSTPVKTLIEVIKQNSAIYEPKSLVENFYDKVLYVEQPEYQDNILENNTQENAQVGDINSASMIDMTMILPIGAAAVSYLILPTIAGSLPTSGIVGSMSISGKDNFLMGEAGLNLLNGIEIF